MNRTVLTVLLFTIFSTACVFPQTFDTKYSSEYVLKDRAGNVLNSFKHYRSGDKMKFVKVSDKGKESETTTEIFVFKNEAKIYTLISGKNYKSGTQQPLDMMSAGMLTGVYILDLGNDGTSFNNKTRVGPVTVNGRECTRYNLVPADAPPGGITDYYFYQDNLMLKRTVGSVEENNTIEATSYDANADVPESIFTLPADVNFTGY